MKTMKQQIRIRKISMPGLLVMAMCLGLAGVVPFAQAQKLEGGSETNLIAGGWTVHVFSEVGTHTLTVSGGEVEVEYLIVAGGGGGASTANSTGRAGGGGGAGGLLQGNTSVSGVQSIVVGAGGEGGQQNAWTGHDPNGKKGGNSSAFGLDAIGGGGGGGVNVGGNGGSGGGNYSSYTSGVGAGTEGQGNDGGLGSTSGGNKGGGGGGAGAAGVPITGGAGLSFDITGSSVTYAVGGDGGTTGAQESSTPAPVDDSTPNRGNGGKGVSPDTMGGGLINGQDGGSGIVVVRWKAPPAGTVIMIK